MSAERLFYHGIPVEADEELPSDVLVIEGYDAEGHPIRMRFKLNKETGKFEAQAS
jgi:hypothetical protein